VGFLFSNGLAMKKESYANSQTCRCSPTWRRHMGLFCYKIKSPRQPHWKKDEKWTTYPMSMPRLCPISMLVVLRQRVSDELEVRFSCSVLQAITGHDYFCSSSSSLRLGLILLILLGSFDSKLKYTIRAFYLWYGFFWNKMLT
jgi:hypothetical protein